MSATFNTHQQALTRVFWLAMLGIDASVRIVGNRFVVVTRGAK